MAETTLREVVTNWPPTTGAGLPDARIAKLTDLIKQASVSREGHLVLSLSRNQESFTAAERISDNQVESVRRITPQLREKTIEAAGRLVLKTNA